MARLRPEQIGVCSWSMRPRNIDALIQTVRELGLKKVQLALLPLINEPADWAGAADKLAAAGIAIVSGMFGTIGEDYSTLESIRKTGGFDPDEHWRQNLQLVERIIPVAQSLGIKTLSCHAGFIPADRKDRQFLKLEGRVSRVAHMLEKAGITMLLETGQESAQTLLALLARMEYHCTENVRVNFDPANIILYGMGDPIASLRTLLHEVKQVHIKDALPATTPGAWGSEVPVGQGAVDWRAFLRVLAEARYAGDLLIEREAGEDRPGDARIAIQELQKIMREEM